MHKKPSERILELEAIYKKELLDQLELGKKQGKEIPNMVADPIGTAMLLAAIIQYLDESDTIIITK